MCDVTLVVQYDKSQSMTVSRSRTALPHHPSLFIGGSSVSISIRLLGVTLDEKLTFEEQFRNMAAAASQKSWPSA